MENNQQQNNQFHREQENGQPLNGSGFWNVVQDAINTGDFSKLNQQVQKSINFTVEGFRDEYKQMDKNDIHGQINKNNSFDRYKGKGVVWRDQSNMGPVGESYYKAAWTPVVSSRNQQILNPDLYQKRPAGSTMGTVLSVVGYPLGGLVYFSAVITGILGLLFSASALGVATSILGIVGTGFLGMGIVGTFFSKRGKRFKKYARAMGNRSYCQLEELAKLAGVPLEKVKKDLPVMIDKKMFRQGHIDKKQTCLMVTDEIYNQYLQTEQQAVKMAREEKQKEDKMKKMPEECQKILQEGNWYIDYIRLCNDDIPGEEMSAKLYRLEEIITRIFKEVERKHELAGDLHKVMNYYLPTTKKLLDVYREMDKETITNDTIQSTKKEIEDTMDTINQAFENLLNSFFQDQALDVSSDISVLHTMLAQEGLTNSDFASMVSKEKENNNE